MQDLRLYVALRRVILTAHLREIRGPMMKLRFSKLRRKMRRPLIAAAALAVLWWVAPIFVPLPPALLESPDASPVFLDRHGAPLAHPPLPDFSRSSPVALDEIPPDLIACTVAAEDKRFFSHGGVDLLATLRAGRDLLLQRRVVSGASTITQQLIKISSPPVERAPLTKVREAMAARRLEYRWSKKQILSAYLNRLDYGNLRIGTAEAARFYFQKPLADLSLAESALLAGLPQAPSWQNPLRHPQRAIARRNIVLRRLAAMGRCDPARIAAALTEPLNLRPLQESNPAPWLANLRPQEVMASVDHRSQTHRIATTLDLPLQRDLEAIVREETSLHKKANLRHAAVVVIHNPTGEILALVSSADWNDPRGGQINGAFAPRSPGSALKPFTYLLSLEHQRTSPATILADIPTPFRTLEGLSLPENYDRSYRGPVTLRSALACSLNLPAMRELNALGGPAPLHELLTSLGIGTMGSDPDFHGLGLTIGNAPVRLIELTNAYATLARLGRHVPAVLFPDDAPPAAETRIPIQAQHFYLIADILSDPAARAPGFPPGGPLDLPFRCAVKTGTSSNFRDNWCLGYTREFTVGVWAGNYENQPMKNLSGTAGAGPVFNRTMVRLHRNHAPTWFEQPDTLRLVTIDSRNGKILPGDPSPLASISAPYARAEWIPVDRLPPIATTADYDESGKAWLTPMYEPWFTSSHNLRRGEFSLDPRTAVVEPLKIIAPANGATYLLDPEIPSGSDRLRPVTNFPGTARWASPSLRIEPADPEPLIHLIPGTHTITATDSRTGESQSLTVHVKNL